MIRIACALTVLLLIFADRVDAVTHETIVITDGQTALTANPEEVKQTMAIMEEASAFFGFMMNESLLPSTPNGTVARSRAMLDYPGGALTYPLNVTIHVELKNTASEYQKYTLEKAGTNMPWNVLSGSQLNAENEKIAELTLPSETGQKKAYDALRAGMAEATDSASAETIKLLLGECLLIRSEQGQAVVMFSRFGNRAGGKSTYKWRYQANGEKQVTSGEGSVFENEARMEHAAGTALQKKSGKQTTVQAGALHIEWSYGLERSFGWFYYDPQHVSATKIAISDFDAYDF